MKGMTVVRIQSSFLKAEAKVCLAAVDEASAKEDQVNSSLRASSSKEVRTASLELSYGLVQLAANASPLAELILGRGGS